MSNPARPPQEPTRQQLMLGSVADAWLPAGFADRAKQFKQVPRAQALLDGLDMDIAKTFVVPRDLTKSPAILGKSGPALATAKAGVPTPRVRSLVAKQVQVAVASKLPATGLFSREVVNLAARGRVFVDGGTEASLGRLEKAYPRRGVVPSLPVTAAEARAAVRRCGLDVTQLPAHARRPFPLVGEEGEESVRVNPKAGSGFPVLAAWSEPGVPELVTQLAAGVLAELRPGRVGEWLLRAEEERPYLVAVRGKAKADYYSPEKVESASLRFYNEFPRHMLLIMQRATQPFELLSRNVLQEGHSGIGMSLVRGGARAMVERLDEQLAAQDFAYVHVGDDSFVVLRPKSGKLCMFALDCSNFDLTQHGTVTAKVHEEFRSQLRSIEQVSADLWYEYARRRLVVVTGALTRVFRHGGPSGMPLQSKVNDVLMDVLINRVVAHKDFVSRCGTGIKMPGDLFSMEGRPRGPKQERGSVVCYSQEELVAELLEQVGRGMGFVVRLEQYYEAVSATTVLEMLAERPFLFVGYYFHNSRGFAEVMCDLPRTLAQLPYPTIKWAREQEELAVLEAMRVGSIALNLGMATPDAAAALGVFRAQARQMVAEVLSKYGDREDGRLRWAVQDSPWAGPTESSLAGLLRALERPAELLWNVTGELPAESTFVPLDWADEVEDEEREELKGRGLNVPKAPQAVAVRALKLRRGVVTTHPATRGNDGRPPPTAVWGPDKPARTAPEFATTARGRRRDGITAREFREAAYEFSASEESDYEYA